MRRMLPMVPNAALCTRMSSLPTSVLIPLPYAADDHQRRNARAMVERAAAVMIDPLELTGERLAKEIVALLAEPERLTRIEGRAREMAVPDAEVRIADLIERAATRSPGSDI